MCRLVITRVLTETVRSELHIYKEKLVSEPSGSSSSSSSSTRIVALLLFYVLAYQLLGGRSQQEINLIYPSTLQMICAVLISVIFCSSGAD